LQSECHNLTATDKSAKRKLNANLADTNFLAISYQICYLPVYRRQFTY